MAEEARSRAGTVQAGTLVFTAGMTDWKPGAKEEGSLLGGFGLGGLVGGND